MTRPVLEIVQLGKTFSTAGGSHEIVKNFNVEVSEGEFVCLLGHSGCGKSTVLSIVMGLSSATVGGVCINGREIQGPGLDRGVVFQSACLFPWRTALDNVLLAVQQAHPSKSRKEQIALAQKALTRAGLADAGERRPTEMSAGMRQRVGIARAFALDPKILLLDEPFSLLDALTRMDLQDQLMRVWDTERKTVMMVTHDVDEALFLADRIVMMTAGPAAGIGKIISVPFDRPRTRADVLNHRDYYWMRDRLTNFLEEQGEIQKSARSPQVAGPERVMVRPAFDL